MFKFSVILLAVFLFPLCFREIRQIRTFIVYCCVFLVSHGISLTNALWFRTLGADADAVDFHNKAIANLSSQDFSLELWENFYVNTLAGFYRLLNSNTIVYGQELSILFYFGSIIIFIKISKLLQFDQYLIISLILLGLLPSMLFVCSVTLREAFEIFFFIFSFYSFFQYYLKHRKKRWLTISLASAIIMGLFHQALAVLAFFLIAIFLSVFLKIQYDGAVFQKSRIMILGISGLLLISALILFKSGLMPAQGDWIIDRLSPGQAVEYIEMLRHKRIVQAEYYNSHALYGIELNTESWLQGAISVCKIILAYFLIPLPWDIFNLKGLYALIENGLRVSLLISSLMFFRQVSIKEKKAVLILLIAYFTVSFIWAMGTVNYGTAIRHHLIGYWILVLLGVPQLAKGFQKGL